MTRPEIRIVIQKRRVDGGWDTAVATTLDHWQCEQISIVLAGIDSAAFAALPAAAQDRIGRNVRNGEPPHRAMN